MRLGDNTSGVGIKPSDYRVIPLTNFHHTISDYSVHRMGEARFYQHFGVKVEQLLIHLLTDYIFERYKLRFSFLPGISESEKIQLLEETIESQRCDHGIERERRRSINRKLALKQKELRQTAMMENELQHQEKLEKARRYQKEQRQSAKSFLKEGEAQLEYKQKMKEKANKWRRERYKQLKSQVKSLS